MPSRQCQSGSPSLYLKRVNLPCAGASAMKQKALNSDEAGIPPCFVIATSGGCQVCILDFILLPKYNTYPYPDSYILRRWDSCTTWVLLFTTYTSLSWSGKGFEFCENLYQELHTKRHIWYKHWASTDRVWSRRRGKSYLLLKEIWYNSIMSI